MMSRSLLAAVAVAVAIIVVAAAAVSFSVQSDDDEQDGADSSGSTSSNSTSSSSSSEGTELTVTSDTVLDITSDSTWSYPVTVSEGATLTINLDCTLTVFRTGQFSVYGTLVIEGGDSAVIKDSGNADYGGAIYVHAGGSCEISNVSFTGCSASYSGGAIYAEGSLTVTDCEFEGCSADFGGGAVCVIGEGQLVEVMDTSFTGNSASFGGAVYIASGGTGEGCTVNLSGCTVNGNAATYHGSGIYLDDESSFLYTGDFELRYNANGGTGAPDTQGGDNEIDDEVYILEGVHLSSASYLLITDEEPAGNGVFLGWSASDSSTRASYCGGDAILIESDTTLYAVYMKISEPEIGEADITISSDAQMDAFLTETWNDSMEGVTVAIIADVTATVCGSMFSGTLDGRGHTVTCELGTVEETSLTWSALFSFLYGATIVDLTVEGCIGEYGSTIYAGFCVIANECVFSGVVVDAVLNSIYNYELNEFSYAGGFSAALAVIADSSTFIDCSTSSVGIFQVNDDTNEYDGSSGTWLVMDANSCVFYRCTQTYLAWDTDEDENIVV